MIFFHLDKRTGKHKQDRQTTENNIYNILLFSSTMVEAAVNEFNNIFMKHFEKAFPVKKSKKKNIRKTPVNAFITKQLLALRALKPVKLSKKPEDKIKYNQ